MAISNLHLNIKKILKEIHPVMEFSQLFAVAFILSMPIDINRNYRNTFDITSEIFVKRGLRTFLICKNDFLSYE